MDTVKTVKETHDLLRKGSKLYRLNWYIIYTTYISNWVIESFRHLQAPYTGWTYASWSLQGNQGEEKKLRNYQESTRFLEQEGKLITPVMVVVDFDPQSSGLQGYLERHLPGRAQKLLTFPGWHRTQARWQRDPCLSGGCTLAALCVASESWKWEVRRLSSIARISRFLPLDRKSVV